MDDDAVSSRWWRLFAAGRDDLRLFVCLRVWQCVMLRKKRRYHGLSPREERAVDFVESGAPLHAMIVFLDECNEDSGGNDRFSLLQAACTTITTTTEVLDGHRRLALYYVLERPWVEQEHLSWLVGKSRTQLLQKDVHGTNLLTHAVIHGCPTEILMLMAVEVAHDALELTFKLCENRQFESARRVCVSTIEEYFAGIPHFPHAECRQLLRESDTLAVINELQSIWRAFIDTWGYCGTPLLLQDLPATRHASLDSFLELAVRAKGEPLCYQWHCDDAPIPNATDSTLVIARNVQPHNEGVYHCVVSNWKGQAKTTALKLVVIDDRYGPDPSLRFLVDRSITSIHGTDEVHHVQAQVGALLPHFSGAVLLLPPRCFQSVDKNGIDVSDSVGMEVLIRVSTSVSPVQLPHGEVLVSPVLDILPHTVPQLNRRALLSIPHHWHIHDPLYELVVTRLPLETDPTSRKPTRYQEIESHRVVSVETGAVTVEIDCFLRYAVVARSVSLKNVANEPPMVEMLLMAVYPSSISSHRRLEPVQLTLYLAYNRSDAIHAVNAAIKQHQELENATSTASRVVWLRQNQVLSLRIGRKHIVTHQWRGFSDGALFTRFRDDVRAPPHEMAIEGDGDHHDPHMTAFCRIEMILSIRKATTISSTDLYEPQQWQTLIPFLHDAVVMPPPPQLCQRRTNQLALAYAKQQTSIVPGAASPVPLFEERHEMERDMIPYYYLVEFARFSETFWERYDRTWWFDKTKSNILMGMYKVVHTGVDPFAVIATDSFAGAFRVAQCSLDAAGMYSEPLLLEPPSKEATEDQNELLGDDDDDDARSTVPSGLRRALTLSPSTHSSEFYNESFQRLGRVLDQVYPIKTLFTDVYGIACDAEAVRKFLEEHRMRFRAANTEIALVLLGFHLLKKLLRKRVLLNFRLFHHVILERFVLLERLVPELDCFPNEYFAVTTELHTLLRDLFQIVIVHTAAAWLSRLLLLDSQAPVLNVLLERVARLLQNEAQGMHAAQDLVPVFDDIAYEKTSVSYYMEKMVTVRLLREYVLLNVTNPSETTMDQLSACIAHAILAVLPPSQRKRLYNDEVCEQIAKELTQKDVRQAIQQLQHQETLKQRIQSHLPAHQARCERILDTIRVRFDRFVSEVDVLHVMRVVNASLLCNVNGQVQYNSVEKLLTFTPSIPFERHVRYQIHLRADAVRTTLGMLTSSTFTFEFSIAG